MPHLMRLSGQKNPQASAYSGTQAEEDAASTKLMAVAKPAMKTYATMIDISIMLFFFRHTVGSIF